MNTQTQTFANRYFYFGFFTPLRVKNCLCCVD